MYKSNNKKKVVSSPNTQLWNAEMAVYQSYNITVVTVLVLGTARLSILVQVNKSIDL